MEMYQNIVKIKTICLGICIIFIYTIVVFAYIDNHNTEDYYQDKIAKQVHGQREVILDDRTRIDIVTDTEVIEVEFAHKFYEAIGQSAHYCVKSGKKPVIWLIKESANDQKYIDRCKNLCDNFLAVQLKSHQWVSIKVNIYDVTKE